MGRTACTEPQCLYKGALYLTLTCIPILSSNAILLFDNQPPSVAEVKKVEYLCTFMACSKLKFILHYLDRIQPNWSTHLLPEREQEEKKIQPGVCALPRTWTRYLKNYSELQLNLLRLFTVVFLTAQFIRDNLGNRVVKTKTMLCSGICRLVVQ